MNPQEKTKNDSIKNNGNNNAVYNKYSKNRNLKNQKFHANNVSKIKQEKAKTKSVKDNIDYSINLHQPNNSDLKNNLKSQTPLNRKLRQKVTPIEPGTTRRMTKPQYFRIKEKSKDLRKRNHSLWRRRVIAVLVLYAILMPLSLLAFWFWLPRHTTPETNDYIYQIGPDNNVLSKKILSWSTVRKENIFYLDMTGIAELCNMTTTGNTESMKYTVKSNGESIEFIIGQSLSYINNIPERMEAICFKKNERIYVPLEFINRCFKGLSATLNSEKNKITIVRETDNKTGDYIQISFPFKHPEESKCIIFTSLDSDIQQEILIREQINKDTAINPSH